MNRLYAAPAYLALRSGYKRNFVLNALWFQALWFLSILGGHSNIAYVLILLLLHFLLCCRPRQEWVFIVLAAVPGIVFDSILTALGVYQFSYELGFFPIPIWLVILWLGFSCTLGYSLNFVLVRPRLAVLLAVIGAPSSYYAAMRLGAVNFPYPVYETLALISFAWAFLMLWFVWLERQRGKLL